MNTGGTFAVDQKVNYKQITGTINNISHKMPVMHCCCVTSLTAQEF